MATVLMNGAVSFLNFEVEQPHRDSRQGVRSRTFLKIAPLSDVRSARRTASTALRSVARRPDEMRVGIA